MQQRMLWSKKSIKFNLELSYILKNFMNKKLQYTIPVFIPHYGCKNACVFCNQAKISGTKEVPTVESVDNYISKYLNNFKNKEKKIEIAFFGGSFTGLPYYLQEAYLKVAFRYVKQGKVDSIRLSTRPDYISPKILQLMKKYQVSTIELGVQSLDKEVLLLSQRGHSIEDVIRACRLIHYYQISLGIQLMIGLPGSNIQIEKETIIKCLNYHPVDLRIYPVYVIAPSKLYDMYLEGTYLPITLEDAVNRTAEVVKICRTSNVRIIRLGLQSTDEITQSNQEIKGPVCDNLAEYVLAKLVLEEINTMIEAYLNNNHIKSFKKDEKIEIETPLRYLSLAIGPKKTNKKILEEKYQIEVKFKGV